METPAPYKTIRSPYGPALLREKGSKFLGFCYPASDAEQAEVKVKELWRAHPDATHICYAYRCGVPAAAIRKNDDGEPAYSAGAPIYGQIEAFGLENILVAVVRYYGGTKLGVGGLKQAYRSSARLCLEAAAIAVISPRATLYVYFEYASTGSVMRLIDQLQLHIRDQKMDQACRLELDFPAKNSKKVLAAFAALKNVRVEQKA